MAVPVAWRIAAVHALFTLVVLGLLGLILEPLFTARQAEWVQTRLLGQAQLVAREMPASGGSTDDLSALVNRRAADLQVWIVAFDATGEPIVSSPQPWTSRTSLRGRAEVAAALGGVTALNQPQADDVIAAAVPAPGDRALWIGVPRAELYAPEQTLLTAAGFGLLLSFASAGLVALVMAGLIGRPLRLLKVAARAIGDGTRYDPLPADGMHEVHKVGATLDRMVQSVEQQRTQLTRERDLLLAVLQTTADGLIITDAQSRVLLINPAAERILGVPPGRSIGSSFVSVVRDHELAAALHASLEAPGPASTQPRLVPWGVPRRMLRVVVAGLPDGLPGRIVVLQDLTELRRLESVRRDFVANISHELRTPLASLKALVETLESGALEDTEIARDFLGRMHVEVDGVIQLVQELLELSRIESGHVELRCAEQSIRDLLVGAAERLRPQADRAGLTLTVAAPDDVPPVMADETRVQQVLLNLIHNALKFTPPGGHIRVSAARVDGEVAVSVADTGEGIAADDLPRIFERFYKVDKSRSSSGTGLGLAIAKHTVQAHGGRIWATSELGQGATFTFTLPLVDPGAPAAATEPASSSEPV